MDMGNIVTPIAILVIFVIVAGFIYWYSRRQKQQRNRLAAELGSDKLEWGKTYAGQIHGKEYFYEYYPGSKNRKSYFKISIDTDSNGEFRVHQEHKFDRLFKYLGITAEIQTGDSDFDRRYYLETDSVAFTRACFDAADTREYVRKLFDLGITGLTCADEKLEAEISPFTFTEKIDRDLVESVVTELVQLRDGLPDDTYEPVLAGTPAWKVKRNAIYTVSVASLILGGVMLFLGLRFYPPLDSEKVFLFSLRYSLAVLVLFCLFAVLWLKGRSSSHRELLTNLLFALFGIPLAGFALVMVLNGYLDSSAITIHEAKVSGKRISHSDKSTSYHLRVKSWRAGHSSEEFKVSFQLYRQVKAGETIVGIATRPGYFQFEWLVSVQIKKPRPVSKFR